MWAVVQPPAGLLTAPITERVFQIRLCFSLSLICCSSSWLRFRTRCLIFTGFSAVDIPRFLFAFVFLSGFPGLRLFARGIGVYFRVIVTAYTSGKRGLDLEKPRLLQVALGVSRDWKDLKDQKNPWPPPKLTYSGLNDPETLG